jgi:hypothetical protein
MAATVSTNRSGTSTRARRARRRASTSSSPRGRKQASAKGHAQSIAPRGTPRYRAASSRLPSEMAISRVAVPTSRAAAA